MSTTPTVFAIRHKAYDKLLSVEQEWRFSGELFLGVNYSFVLIGNEIWVRSKEEEVEQAINNKGVGSYELPFKTFQPDELEIVELAVISVKVA